MSDQEPKLFPAWRQVEADLVASGALVDGAVIPMDFFRSSLGLQDPKDMLDGAEAIRQQGIFNFAMGELNASLLETHRVKLSLVPSVGYMVVPPDQQTRRAMKERRAELRCVMEKAIRDVTFVRLDRLNEEQRKENHDALAKFGLLAAMVQRRLKGRV